MSKRKKRKPVHNYNSNHHHIIPRSRHGSDGMENIKLVPVNAHSAYHAIFYNLTPDEIIQYLKDVWFNAYERFLTPKEWQAMCHPTS
jgi:hypothetical protein